MRVIPDDIRWLLRSLRDLSVFDDLAILHDPQLRNFRQFDTFHFTSRCPFELMADGATYISVTIFDNRVEQFQWVFDCRTGAALFQTSCSNDGSRIETLLDLLGHMAGDRIPSETDVEAFEALSFHELHFVRWRAVQGLANLNAERALHRLAAMRSDAHPHIREMAAEIYSQHEGEHLNGV